MDFNIRYDTKANATSQVKNRRATDNIRRSIQMRNVTLVGIHIKGMAAKFAFFTERLRIMIQVDIKILHIYLLMAHYV